MSHGSTDGARRQRIWVEHGDKRMAVVRWGDADSSKPPALLLHGTGFVAEVWEEAAEALASSYTVYALDRRGHGSSHKPAAGEYHFIDFALDVCAVVTTLGLSEILGVGHSAGATDLLLAAKLLPERFRRVFALEPTVMNCSASRGPQATLSDERKAVLQRALRRRAEFDDAVAAFERLRAAPAFARWSEVALWMYVRHGFETLQDGRVRLRCTPQIEAAMLEPIFEAMEQIYSGDARGNPFSWLSEIQCPVRISTAETSAPIYKQMAALALELVPAASQWHFSKVGHCVAQEAHALLLDALAVFDADPRS